jgi:L-lactate utilization protein LutC
MERTEFLDRLRHRLSSPAPEPLPHRHAPSQSIPEAGWPQVLDDPAGAFRETAQRKGAIVRRSGDPSAVIEEVIAAESVRSAVVSAEPETASAAGILEAAGVEVLPWNGTEAAARADLGITGAAFGIAATGSIVVDAGRAGGRTASLLPPVHLAILPADRLLKTPADLWRHMPERFPGGPPSQAVVITGPSKTGDIEMTLTTGVHGPGRLWICLLG